MQKVKFSVKKDVFIPLNIYNIYKIIAKKFCINN